jgi:Calpain family cysteine protease
MIKSILLINKRIGFYTLKFYMKNQWKEYIVDDMLPVTRSEEPVPIFSNNKNNDLGWALLFKCNHYHESRLCQNALKLYLF